VARTGPSLAAQLLYHGFARWSLCRMPILPVQEVGREIPIASPLRGLLADDGQTRS
jgi:hypothetical protein